MNSSSSYIFLANSLNAFNNSKNFKKDIIEFIQNTSPMLSQQFAIPGEEFIRLNKKFLNSEISNNYNSPNFIILKKDEYIYKNMKKNIKDFCILFDENFYVVYIHKINNIFCIK